ncbi:MAG: hypothetical protein RLZZ624_1121, partial [Cyanobacteriota bacterium]
MRPAGAATTQPWLQLWRQSVAASLPTWAEPLLTLALATLILLGLARLGRGLG